MKFGSVNQAVDFTGVHCCCHVMMSTCTPHIMDTTVLGDLNFRL